MLSFLSKKKFLIGILLLFLVLVNFGFVNFSFGLISDTPQEVLSTTDIDKICREHCKDVWLFYADCINECQSLLSTPRYGGEDTEGLMSTFDRIRYWLRYIGLLLSCILAIVIGATITTIVTVLIAIIDFLAYFFGGSVKDIAEGKFIQLAYTNPEYNPIIKVGLDITLPFANMFFILILVVIATATILRIESYGLKKTLVPLIIIALLINFLPLFCGLVVDFANLIMRFFLANPDHPITGWKGFADRVKEIWAEGGFWEMVKPPKDLYFNFRAESILRNNMIYPLIFKGIGVVIIGILNIFVLGIYFFLLILRYVMIWNFVIIGPVALACYILPATRGYFDWWLKQFFQWAFIGVMAGFFIFLGNAINISIADVAAISLRAPHGQTKYADDIASIIASFLPYTLAPIFMLKGIFEGFKTTAMFGDSIIREAKKAGRWAKQELAWKPFKKEVVPGLEEKLKTKEIAGGISGALRKIPFIRKMGPVEMLKEYGLVKKSIKDAEKRAENLPKEEILRQVKEREVRGYDAVGFLTALNAQKGGANYLYNELKEDPKFQKRFSELYTLGIKGKVENDMLKDPRLARFVQDKEPFKEITKPGKTRKTIMEATKSIKPDDAKLWSAEPLQSKAIVEIIAQRGENEVLRVFNRDQTESFNTTFSKIIKRDVRMGRRAGFSEPDIRANISTKFGNYTKALEKDTQLQAKGFETLDNLINRFIPPGGTTLWKSRKR